MSEINSIYDLQGASISRKHVEVIVRQMFSRRKVSVVGDSSFVVGEIVEAITFEEENEKIREAGGEEAEAVRVVLGISEVATNTTSFLSAASFQNTTRVLIRSALKGARDNLRGLKENVIIGRLIPVGTGFKTKEEQEVESQKPKVKEK